jgi:membrane fusion protein (multidrug efflux system)
LDNLYKDNNVSQQMLDEAESEAFIARSDWHRARENKLLAELELNQATEILSMRTITSPISGIVVDRMLSPGELVTEDQTIMQLANIDPLYVEVIMPAADFGRVLSGSLATVVPAEPIGGQYEGRVTIVDNIIDAASGTFGVRIELSNADKALPAGLNCVVEFALEVTE